MLKKVVRLTKPCEKGVTADLTLNLHPNLLSLESKCEVSAPPEKKHKTRAYTGTGSWSEGSL